MSPDYVVGLATLGTYPLVGLLTGLYAMRRDRRLADRGEPAEPSAMLVLAFAAWPVFWVMVVMDALDTLLARRDTELDSRSSKRRKALAEADALLKKLGL